MATVGQAAPAVAVDPSTGLTHMVWNQDGQVWSAYYDPVAKHWVDAAAIPGSVSGQSLQLNANVGMLGADGNVTNGLIATWTNGDGNEAEVNGAVALSSPLGGYQWSQPIGLTDDNLEDSNLQVAVTDDGRVTIVTHKIDADDPQAQGHLSTSTLTLHQQDLTLDGGPRAAIRRSPATARSRTTTTSTAPSTPPIPILRRSSARPVAIRSRVQMATTS